MFADEPACWELPGVTSSQWTYLKGRY